MRAPRANTIGYQQGSKGTPLLANSILFQILVIFEVIIKCKCALTNTSFEITACYDNTSTTDVIKNKPRVVDVIPGSIVHMWCHFCFEKGDYFPKLWFYKPRGNQQPKEILPEIETNYLTTKLSMTPLHVLSINHFNVNNSGIYSCKNIDIKKNQTTFVYIIEGIFNIDINPKVGTLNEWQEYKRNYIDTINKKFKSSKDEPFKSLRRRNNLTFQLTTIWDNWSECKDIDHQRGIRKRLGRCRLGVCTNNNTIEKVPKIYFGDSNSLEYLTDGFDIPCRSLRLNETVPEISNIVRNIPDFEAEEICRVLKRTAKYKLNKEKFKHKNMKEVAENSHVTLLCTEVIPNSDLKWFKEETLLNSLFRKNICKNEEEPHISVDTNNSLHILHITKNEEGNYSCLLNGRKVQEFEVKVLSKSKLLNQEFIRYSIYLGFVLSLTMTCYCAGVIVAWHRRSSFADPLNLNKKGNYDCHRMQCEKERLLQ